MKEIMQPLNLNILLININMNIKFIHKTAKTIFKAQSKLAKKLIL